MIARGRSHALKREVEHAKNPGETLKRLMVYLKPYSLTMGIIFIAILCSTLLSVAAPAIIGKAVDVLYNFVKGGVKEKTVQESITTFVQFIVLLGAVYLGGWVFNVLSHFLLTVISQKVLYNLRKDIFLKIQSLSVDFFDKTKTGDIMSKLSNDTATLNRVLNMGLNRFLGSVLTLAGIIVAMFLLNIRLAFISLLMLPVMVLATAVFSRRARKAFQKTRRTIGSVNVELEENITGIKTAQAFNRTGRNSETFKRVNAENRDANVNAETVLAAFSPTMDILSTIGLALILGYGGWLALKGFVTIGLVVAFLQYIRRFFQPVRAVSILWGNMQSAVAGAERIFQLLDEKPAIVEKLNPIIPASIKGQIEFRDVYFSYTGKIDVLKGINLSITANTTAAIVGPTGAGKTTLISLLARFYDVTKGKILVDGFDIRDLKLAEYRRNLGIVLQDPFLFRGTIAENIRYGKLNASLEEIVEASKKANAHNFIENLPGKYNTELTEGAQNISRGQRQLIAIARTILADPKILILDEATSSVDTRTELFIQEALENLFKDRTSFIIAHRLSTVKNADTIIVIENGVVVEQGSHFTLIEKRGTYYKLYKEQSIGPIV
ncbi:MAG: ABC transporter ATP-binding protein [Spirochaetales bacterium]|nr:ABC transporter ATP-binding protein [Spirochaetales bacterium]